MRGYNLRGALDWATARTPSTTILSVYTQHWGSLLAEAEAPGADHAVKHLEKGDRLEVAFNHTLCFAAAVADRYELCFFMFSVPLWQYAAGRVVRVFEWRFARVCE